MLPRAWASQAFSWQVVQVCLFLRSVQAWHAGAVALCWGREGAAGAVCIGGKSHNVCLGQLVFEQACASERRFTYRGLFGSHGGADDHMQRRPKARARQPCKFLNFAHVWSAHTCLHAELRFLPWHLCLRRVRAVQLPWCMRACSAYAVASPCKIPAAAWQSMRCAPAWQLWHA